MIEAKTYRYRGHYEGDPMVYRLPGEMEKWQKRDPIPTFRLRLFESEIISEGELEELWVASKCNLTKRLNLQRMRQFLRPKKLWKVFMPIPMMDWFFR